MLQQLCALVIDLDRECISHLGSVFVSGYATGSSKGVVVGGAAVVSADVIPVVQVFLLSLLEAKRK